jgi:hypothetical protein
MLLYLVSMFDVGVTFEMREPNTEKSIFRLIKIAVSQHLLNGRVKGKVAERQREREEWVCECRPMLTTASVNIHNNNTQRERKRPHRNTYGKRNGNKTMWRPLWLISGFWWDLGWMLILTLDLVTLSDIWTTTIQVRLVYHKCYKTFYGRKWQKRKWVYGLQNQYC